MNDNLIVLDLPANREYIAVLRCALGGVAIAGDLNVDQLDDLRSAADEAFDSIINQNACIDRVEMRATIQPHSSLSVQIRAVYGAESILQDGEKQADLTLTILQTLVPNTTISLTSGKCIQSICISIQ